MTAVKPITSILDVYRDIPDFPGYRVFNGGRVQSCYTPQRGRVGRGRTHVMSGVWHDIRLQINHGGYLQVSLRRDGTNHHRLVHRLVLESFVGPCPPGMQCCHWDGDRTNNRLDNLRWGTHRENVEDQIRHGTIPRGERNGSSRLRERNIPEIFRLRESGMTNRAIAARFAVGETTIEKVLRGKTWSHVSGVAHRGERGWVEELPESVIEEIFHLHAFGRSYREIAFRLNVRRPVVRAVLRGGIGIVSGLPESFRSD